MKNGGENLPEQLSSADDGKRKDSTAAKLGRLSNYRGEKIV